jgi:hypothetical protein
MQAGVSVFPNASESAECTASCCERMHMPADSVNCMLWLNVGNWLWVFREGHGPMCINLYAVFMLQGPWALF